LKTGEMKTFGGKEGILHSGFHLPADAILKSQSFN